MSKKVKFILNHFLTAALRIRSNYALAYCSRGKEYYKKRMYDQAIEDFTVALRIDTSYVDAYVNRGNAYYAKGDKKRAYMEWSKALQLDPNNATARDYLERY
jgi:tetratricopeptide (TPR) repeat protein